MAIPSANEAIRSAQRILESVQHEAETARAIREGDRRAEYLSGYHKQNVLRIQLVTHAWRKIGRKVLGMHPEVVEEVRVASSDKVPTEILRALPYLNPMVVYADPPVFDTWMRAGQSHPVAGRSETSMRLLGFLTAGTSDGIVATDGEKARIEQRIHSTSDPNADRFLVVLVMEALDELGHGVGIEFDTVTFRFDQTLTLAETVDDVMSRFHWEDVGVADAKRSRRWMREVLSVVVGTLFYLCSTILEAEQVPPKFVAKRIPKRVVRTPISFYKVGWTAGTALTRLRQQRGNVWAESEQGDITHEQNPQHRKAHFKMQPYGPGRALRKLIFVSAYWTKLERLGEAGMNIAHQVPALGKGESRESVKTALAAGQIERIANG